MNFLESDVLHVIGKLPYLALAKRHGAAGALRELASCPMFFTFSKNEGGDPDAP